MDTTQPTTEELLAIIASLQSTVQSMQANNNTNSIRNQVADMLDANVIARMKNEQAIREYSLKHPLLTALFVQPGRIAGSIANMIGSVELGMSSDAYTNAFRSNDDFRTGN